MPRDRSVKYLRTVFVLTIVLIGGIFAGCLFLNAIYVPPILMYHSIDYSDDDSNRLIVSPESFARHMAFLARGGYRVIPLREMAARIERGEKISYKTLSITLDDGLENNYTYAYPLLKRYDIPATFFVISDFVGRKGYLNWEEIEEMAESGIVEIGSHTKTHPWLTGLTEAELMEELRGSKKALEARIKKDVDLFCYPMGAYNDTIKRAVRNAGYRAAVSTNPGKDQPIDDIYALKRQRISNTSDSLFVFWVESSGYYTFIKEHRDD